MGQLADFCGRQVARGVAHGKVLVGQAVPNKLDDALVAPRQFPQKGVEVLRVLAALVDELLHLVPRLTLRPRVGVRLVLA